MFRPCCLSVAVLTAAATPLFAAEAPNDLAVLLGRELLSPRLVLREVQTYTAGRVPSMPAVKSQAEWEVEAGRLRAAILDRVVFRGEAASGWRKARTQVQWLDTIAGGPGYRIKKLRHEVLPGVWIPASGAGPSSGNESVGTNCDSSSASTPPRPGPSRPARTPARTCTPPTAGSR
jgi:hypothetical protein